jgi:hypothetical protein
VIIMKTKIEELTHKALEKSRGKDLMLPNWPNNKRGTPNTFLRSALFSAIQSKDRADLKGAVIASQSGIIVTYTGQQLNQEDLSVWECIVNLAKQHPLGCTCEFTAYEILKSIGLPNGGENHKRLHEVIIRLTACAIEIKHAGPTFFGSLISSGLKDELTGHYKIELSRDLIKLYGKTEWTGVNWDQRNLLKRKPLAQALHGYYSSHKKPHPIKLETLQKYTGGRNKQLAGFKIKVHAALNELVKIGFLDSFFIDGSLVYVTKKPRL